VTVILRKLGVRSRTQAVIEARGSTSRLPSRSGLSWGAPLQWRVMVFWTAGSGRMMIMSGRELRSKRA